MLTSLLEGTPNVLIEAQAMGLPVVASAARGSAETVEDGVTGRILTRETAADFAAAVLAFLENRKLRERVRSAGPLWVERRFGMERMVDDTLRLYAEAGASWAAARIRG
jgi:glycosyltransferase involved in cell wall biosynthesis